VTVLIRWLYVYYYHELVKVYDPSKTMLYYFSPSAL